MADDFTYDVFLSHSAHDLPVARALAERLRADGLRVWLAEWELKPGDSIPSKIEEGLEHSRTLLLLMSAHSSGPDWPQLARHTFRFEDPLNPNRRLIPLRLDSAPIPDSLTQLGYVNRSSKGRKKEYANLLEACRQLVKQPIAKAQAAGKQIGLKAFQLDCKNTIINAYAFSPDGKLALSGSNDNTVRVWDVETGRCLRVLEGHTNDVMSVAWGADQHRAFSGDEGGGIRVWDLSEVVTTARVPGVAISVPPSRSEQVQYTNAKVLLVGESGACKTGLSKVLAGVGWEPSDSTVGAWATQWKLPVEAEGGTKEVRQIVFEGERFDVMSVRRWRDRVLAQKG